MKTITKITLGILLTSISLFADIQFDLHAQHFSKAIEGKYAGARYELADSYVSTNLAYIDGAYITQDDSGYMNVEIKEPKEEWSISIDCYYNTTSSFKFRTIKLTANNGESILISIKLGEVLFNGEDVYNTDYYARLTLSITKNGDEVSLVINGSKVGTAQRASFSGLKYVEVQAISESSGYDKIHSLTIGSK